MGWLSFKTCQMLFFKQIVANFVNLSFVRILLWASTDICKQCPFTYNTGETENSNFHRNTETCFGWKSARPIQIEHGQFWTPDYSSEELPSHPSLLPLSPPPFLYKPSHPPFVRETRHLPWEESDRCPVWQLDDTVARNVIQHQPCFDQAERSAGWLERRCIIVDADQSL